MSRIETPRTWIDQLLGRNGPMTIDDPTLDRLQRGLRRVEPDPLFRRRLRGEVLNRYVAVREGMLQAPRRRRQMGKLGRATLYASVGLVVSATAAGAASQRALPGDLLFPLKLQLEEIRMRVAPAHLQDDLAVMALEARLDEVEALAAGGNWSGVAHAAAGVVAAEKRVVAFGSALDSDDAEAISKHVAVLQSLLAQAPAAALPGLRTALEASSHFDGAAHGDGSPAFGSGTGGQGGQGAPGATSRPAATPEPKPAKSSDPRPTPKPKPSAPPTPEARPSGPASSPAAPH
jgi:hypothetical protein